MGAGFHGGFGNTKGAKKYIFYAENKREQDRSIKKRKRIAEKNTSLFYKIRKRHDYKQICRI